MASQGDKTTGKDEGEVKSTPSNQEVAPPLVSSTKGTKLCILYFLLFCFLSWRYFMRKCSCLRLTSIVKAGNFLVWRKFDR